MFSQVPKHFDDEPPKDNGPQNNFGKPLDSLPVFFWDVLELLLKLIDDIFGNVVRGTAGIVRHLYLQHARVRSVVDLQNFGCTMLIENLVAHNFNAEGRLGEIASRTFNLRLVVQNNAVFR